jgi:tetratricopeptide (TPR) repeat protein
LAFLLGKLGRQSERIEELKRGISTLAQGLQSTSKGQPDKAQSLEKAISGFKEQLCQAYVQAGRRQDVVSLVDAELKKKPVRSVQASRVSQVLQALGMGQAALEVGRLAEATEHMTPPNDPSSRQLARAILDGQLRQMGFLNELKDRLETRRTLGEELRAIEYTWLGTNIYQGEEAVAILSEGIKKHPDSVGLLSDYMQVLAKAGRKAEAWGAYEKARDLFFAKVARSELSASPGETPDQPEPLSPAGVAGPWYAFLLQEGKLDEFTRLENRLVETCSTTRSKPEELALPRASAEFATQRYEDAVKSFQICLREGLGNEIVIAGALARSLRALGRRQEAIPVYRRAIQLSDVDSGLLS